MKKAIGAAAVMAAGALVLAAAAGAQGQQDAQAGAGTQATGQANGGSGLTRIQQSELDYLHQRIGVLERQNAELQGQLNPARGGSGAAGTQAADTGTGGAGNAGANTGNVGGTGGAGTQGGARSGTTNAQGRAGASQGSGVAVATVTFEGKVRSVRQGLISILDEEGLRYDLVVDRRTQMLRDGRTISLDQLHEGTPVQATFDLIAGNDHATRIEVISSAPAPKRQSAAGRGGSGSSR